MTLGGFFSDYFVAVNGVKQGGVLSPLLFCVYLDGLLIALSKSKVGCFIGDVLPALWLMQMTLFCVRQVLLPYVKCW